MQNEYVRMELIESDGTMYIDTGVDAGKILTPDCTAKTYVTILSISLVDDQQAL